MSTIIKISFPRGRKIVLCFTNQAGSVHQPTHCSLTHGNRPAVPRPEKTSTVFNTEIPNWHAVRQDACSTVPPYTRSCHAHTRVRKREPKKKTVLACGPSWRISRFHALLASTVQPRAVGPRVPKPGGSVVFRTEPLSDIPPFRGAFTGFPTPFEREGRAATRPTGEGKARRWAPFMFREHVFSSAGWGRQDKV